MNRLWFLLVLLPLIVLSGCRALNPSIMLRTERGYNYDLPPDTIAYEYRISSYDLLQFRLFSNDGFKLVDLTTTADENSALTQQRLNIQYLVEFDGKVKLPVLGRVQLAGLTIRQAEIELQRQYERYYNDPFVLLRIVNRRVIIFPGAGGQAQVVNLLNENTTLMEALAMAGGIANIGKAHKIKLIRETGAPEPDVYLIDLSTIDGINQGDIVLQAGDIIYVEPQFQLLREILQEVTPLVSLISSAVVIVAAVNALSRN